MLVYSNYHTKLMYKLPQNILSKIYSYDVTYKLKFIEVLDELKLKFAVQQYTKDLISRYFIIKNVEKSENSKIYYLTISDRKYKPDFSVEFMPIKTFREIKHSGLENLLKYNNAYYREILDSNYEVNYLEIHFLSTKL